MLTNAHPPVLDNIITELPSDVPLWLVGGALRDHLLGLRAIDLDFVVAGDAIRVARELADRWGVAYYDLDRERGVGRVLPGGLFEDLRSLDFTALRGANIEADLNARDFTINALAYPIHAEGRWLDPLGGVRDAKDKVLRVCSPEAIANDPVRALRAVRLATSFQLRMTPETTEAVRRDGVQMGRVSAERLRDEFFLMLAAPHPSQPIRLLDHLSLLVVFLPQLYPQPGAEGFDPQGVAQIETGLQLMSRLSDILGVLAPSHDPEAPVNAWVAEVGLRLGRFREPLAAHLARVIRGDRTARQLLYLGGLLQPVHAMNKRAVQDPTSSTLSESTSVTSASIGDHLRLSRRESQTLGLILENSIDLRIFAREGQPDASWAHRYFREAGSAGVEALLLSLAVSIEGSSGGLTQEWRSSVESVRSLFEAYFEHFDEIVDPQSVIRGEELIRHLGLSPGPLIGKLLRAIRVAQAEGTVKSRADALAYARKRYMELED